MAKEEVILKVKELIAAPSCCAEAKAAAEAYLDAAGTEREAAAEAALAAELKEDVTSIDNYIEFVSSDLGKQIFGEEKAAAMLTAGKAVKAAGFEFHVWTVDELGKTLEAFGRGAQTVTTNCAKSQLDEYGAASRR